MKRYLLSLLFSNDACCEVTGIDADRDGDTGTDDDTVVDTITIRKEQRHTTVILNLEP